MFRKITSKRPPGVSLARELARLFAPYLSRARLALEAACRRYPRVVLAGMLLAITLSAGLCFKLTFAGRRDTTSGRTLQQAGARQQGPEIKAAPGSPLRKPALSKADSQNLTRQLNKPNQ
jgi:hypothetical protein